MKEAMINLVSSQRRVFVNMAEIAAGNMDAFRAFAALLDDMLVSLCEIYGASSPYYENLVRFLQHVEAQPTPMISKLLGKAKVLMDAAAEAIDLVRGSTILGAAWAEMVKRNNDAFEPFYARFGEEA